jgi:hypothetical protein
MVPPFHINSMSVVLAITISQPLPRGLGCLRRLRHAREHTRSVTALLSDFAALDESAADHGPRSTAVPALVLNSLPAYYLAVTQFSLNPSLPCV